MLYVNGSYIQTDDLRAICAKIGGFDINTNGIYKGCTSLTSTSTGVYMGTNGLRLYSAANKVGFTFDANKGSFEILNARINFTSENGELYIERDKNTGAISCRKGLHIIQAGLVVLQMASHPQPILMNSDWLV